MKIDLSNMEMDITDLIVNNTLFKFSRLAISGIEVTQTTQHYKASAHLTDPADQGPDNSIRLIAGKPAMARVYLWSSTGISGITGTLEVQRRRYGFLWETVMTLTPLSPPLTSIPSLFVDDYATVRGNSNKTLNFLIPADEMLGTLRLVAKVEAGAFDADHSVTVPVTLRQTLRLAGVMIAYDGPASMAPNAPNLQLPAPTLTDLQAMAARALALYPVQSQAEFRSAGSMTLNDHLQDTSFPASGCGTAWNALHAQVVAMKTADGNQPGWIYYGLFDDGVPRGPVGGCGGGGVGVGPINNPGTLAHEAGHAAGLGHAPAGGAPNPDPNYPAYEPYDPAGIPHASIGEYGVDVNNGTVASPHTFRDFMAYGGPAWISPYHYGKLIDNALLNPVTVGVDEPWWKDIVFEEYKKWPWLPLPDPPPFQWELPMFPPDYPMEKVISLIVRIENDEIAEVMHVARTMTRTHIERATQTDLVASLCGIENEVLAQAVLYKHERLPGDCGECSEGISRGYLAQAFIPDVDDGASITITRKEQVLWRREATKKPCKVSEFKAKIQRTDGAKEVLTVSWKITNRFQDVWIRWSIDGENWKSLSTGVRGEKAQFDPKMLPSGKVMLQLVAHDGFFSNYSKPVGIEIRKYPPEATILHPGGGYTYMEGQTLRLWGMVAQEGQTNPSNVKAVWYLGRKKIAKGLDTSTTFKPGKHALTLQVEGEGGKGKTSVTIEVTKRPKQKE